MSGYIGCYSREETLKKIASPHDRVQFHDFSWGVEESPGIIYTIDDRLVGALMSEGLIEEKYGELVLTEAGKTYMVATEEGSLAEYLNDVVFPCIADQIQKGHQYYVDDTWLMNARPDGSETQIEWDTQQKWVMDRVVELYPSIIRDGNRWIWKEGGV